MKYIDLIKARKKAGYTQKQMAEMIGMEQTTYSKKERGLSPIRDIEWSRLAKILEVNIDEVRNGKDLSNSIKKTTETSNHVVIPLSAFEIIIKYNGKLEEENASLKELLKKTSP